MQSQLHLPCLLEHIAKAFDVVLQFVHNLLGGTVLAAVALMHLMMVLPMCVWMRMGMWMWMMGMGRSIGCILFVALRLGIFLVHTAHLHQSLASERLQDLLCIWIVLHGCQHILA